jgi:hypothetical protein
MYFEINVDFPGRLNKVASCVMVEATEVPGQGKSRNYPEGRVVSADFQPASGGTTAPKNPTEVVVC